jgi:hypothetical protein
VFLVGMAAILPYFKDTYALKSANFAGYEKRGFGFTSI